MSSNIIIDVAAEFTGKKAFSQAEKSIDKLGRTLKQALIGGSLLSLTNQAIKAFAEEEKSAKLLANTLQNLGFGMATKSVEAFITQIQLATGASDTDLRPAMAKLVQTYGSVALAQDALTLAMDVSASSGVDLATVVDDIAAAQMGNIKGLRKYALGLTQVQLKTMTATEIMARFNKVFGGGAAIAADTFAGKLARINQALGEAKEALGKGIIDALMIATGSQDIDTLQKKIIDFGKNAGDAVRNLAEVFVKFLPQIKAVGAAFAILFTIGKIQTGVAAFMKIMEGMNKAMKALRITALTTAIAEAFVLNPLGGIAVAAGIIAVINAVGLAVDGLDAKFTALGTKTTDFFDQTNGLKFGQKFTLENYKKIKFEQDKAAGEAKKNAEALRKAEAKAAADRAKLAKDEAAAKQKTDKLAKAAAMFDLSKIQINAALQGKITDEEKLRLQLQQAILNENDDLADKLQQKLEASQMATAKLSAQIIGIKPATDPFAAWLSTLEGIATTLSKILGMPVNMTSSSMINPNQPIVATQTPNSPFQPTPVVVTPPTNNEPIPVVITPTEPTIPTTNNPIGTVFGTGGFGFSVPGGMGGSLPQVPVTVNVTVEGTILAQDEFVAAVSDAVITANTYGNRAYRAGAVDVNG